MFYNNLFVFFVLYFCFQFCVFRVSVVFCVLFLLLCRGSDKSLARPLPDVFCYDGKNISFDASLVIYINSTNIPPIMIINKIYEHQTVLSL
jgi:hypothetical protein